jgi:hypothetical protein
MLYQDSLYKYLSGNEKSSVNIVVKPSLRKYFIIKWYCIINIMLGCKAILRHKKYRYRFDNQGYRYVIIYVPLKSIRDIELFLYFIFMPFRIKKIQNRLILRVLVERYHFSISFSETQFNKQVLAQLIQLWKNGKSSKYIKKHL